jgi:hypothetical protein
MNTPEDQREIQKKRSSYEDSMSAAKSHWNYALSKLNHLNKNDPDYSSQCSHWGSEVSKYETEYSKWKSLYDGLG